jgi:hypothetical protein
LIQVTPENYYKLKALDEPLLVVDPEKVDWFNKNTDAPELYFCKHSDGTFEFFNRWGYDPQNNAELQPVTAQVREEYENGRRIKLEEANTASSLNAVAVAKEKQDERDTQIRADQLARLNFFKSLFNQKIADPAKHNVVLSVESTSSNDEFLEGRLIDLLTNHSKLPDISILGGYFSPEFKKSGYFDKAFNGDTSSISEAGAFHPIAAIILCKVESQVKPNQIEDGIVNCDLTLSYVLIDNRGREIGNGAFSVTGLGTTEQQALERALEVLVEKHSDDIFRNAPIAKS